MDGINRYKELDALRGIAAVSVVLFHFTLGRHESELGFKFGVSAVDLFFMISGFVIFMSLGRISEISEFLVNRFTRIYPAWWACVTFTFLLRVFHAYWQSIPPEVSISDYLANMTMFHYYFGIKDLDGPYWTMIVEMLFYLAIAILFISRQLKNIIPIGLAMLGTTITLDLWLENKYPNLHSLHDYFPLATHFPLFFAGIIFFLIMKSNYPSVQKAFLYFCIGLCFISSLLLFDDGGRNYVFLSRTEYIFPLTLYFLIFILFINNKLRFLAIGPVLWLGKISFPLYLVHQYLSIHILIPGFMNKIHLGYWTAFMLSLPIVIGSAAFVHYFIEVPGGRILNKGLRILFGLPKRSYSES